MTTTQPSPQCGTQCKEIPCGRECRHADKRTWDGRPLYQHMAESELWGRIQREARTDPGLQDLLNQAEIYYKLKYG